MRRVLAAVSVLMAVVCPAVAAAQSQDTLEVVANFKGPNYAGVSPSAPPVEGSYGLLYGTTAGDGAYGGGTVFRIDSDGRITTVHHFRQRDGSGPRGGLAQAQDGTLYGVTANGGAYGLGTIFQIEADGTFSNLHSFRGRDGAYPLGVILGSDGLLYGSTANGGESFRNIEQTGRGSLFKLVPTQALSTLHSFMPPEVPTDPGALDVSPVSKLVEGRDGELYGIADGAPGIVYRVTKSGHLTVVARAFHPLSARPTCELMLGRDGDLYGCSLGWKPFMPVSVWKITGDGQFANVYTWERSAPGVVTGIAHGIDGALYMTTTAGIFRLSARGELAAIRIGAGEAAASLAFPLMQASDGLLYGIYSGVHGDSAGAHVFALNYSGGYRVIHTFAPRMDGEYSPGSLVEGANGEWYGTTSADGAGGTVFKMARSGSLVTLQRFDANTAATIGLSPGLLTRASNGLIYGATSQGGEHGFGTLFSLSSTGEMKTLYSFTADQGRAQGTLVQVSAGTLVGATANTVFTADLMGRVTPLYAFQPLPGWTAGVRSPRLGSDGRLYGVTTYGGDSMRVPGDGTIYRVDFNGNLQTLHAFSNIDGSFPTGHLVEWRQGLWCGTVSEGGVIPGGGGGGTLFCIGPSGQLQLLHRFSGRDGAGPYSGLLLGPDDRLYGTTIEGGRYGAGTVFAIDASGVLTTIHDFSLNAEGTYAGDLVLGSDGRIYGTTLSGGPGGGGVVFRITLAGGAVSVVPGRIEAEDYDRGGDGVSYVDTTPTNLGGAYRNDAVDIKPSREGGYAVGWFVSGEWLAYTVRVPLAGRYVLRARVGSTLTGRTFRIELDGRDVTGPIAVPLVSDWDRYETVAAPPVTITAGTHTLRLVMGPQDYMDVQWLEVAAAPAGRPLPGTIEAEDYDAGGPGVGYLDTTAGNIGGVYRADDVDLKPSRDGGYAVGWFVTGEWLAYTVNVQAAGRYTIAARVGSALPGRTFTIQVDGATTLAPTAVPQQVDWDRYATVTAGTVELSAGTHALRVAMGPQDWVDFDRLIVTTAASAEAVSP